MSAQLQKLLTRLGFPNARTPIVRPRDHMFAIGREGGRDHPVRMPLQKPNLSARCGVPNTRAFVIRCGDYAFSVRRESSGPHSTRVSDQSLLTVGDIPDASCPIDGTGDDAFTV